MNPEVKDLVLRVHTRIESDKSEPPPKGDLTEPVLPKYASEALSIDCETTTEELGQKLNFAFYQKCKLRNGGYATTEEGIVVADDLERREGKRAVQLLHQFARTHRAN